MRTGSIRSFSAGFTGRRVLPEHAHAWHQLLYASEGVMRVRTSGGIWVVPPGRAVWIPGGVVHSVELTGWVFMRTLYFARDIAVGLPNDCCVVNVSPLLRELIIYTTKTGPLDTRVPAHARLAGVILDQLQELQSVPLQLSIPIDPRARQVAETMRLDPGETRSLEELAAAAGASRRTIERLFRAETGMTFGTWRQQLRFIHALELLAAGEKVTAIALDCGYESSSAFIARFRRVFGTTPGRYFRGAR